MSKKNHTLATIIIIILCLVIGGTLLFYHFAPSSPTRPPHKDLPPSQTPIAEIEPNTPHIEESTDPILNAKSVMLTALASIVLYFFFPANKKEILTNKLKPLINNLGPYIGVIVALILAAIFSSSSSQRHPAPARI